MYILPLFPVHQTLVYSKMEEMLSFSRDIHNRAEDEKGICLEAAFIPLLNCKP